METSAQHRPELRPAAILAAGVAGYLRLIGADEEGALSRVLSIRAELIDPTIPAHRVSWVETKVLGMAVPQSLLARDFNK